MTRTFIPIPSGIRIFILKPDTLVFYDCKNSRLVVSNNSHAIAIAQNIRQAGEGVRCYMNHPLALAVGQQLQFDLALDL
ncbi:hypothetical protein WI23_13440 [Burkholderia oklahomensis C6786]|nr:hypothetical protein WI23_13440 [Burkholderia oklahomensis C6786]KUY62874.1 hypothetical protein WI23_08335 [Burkholderia oklahomensis C6786]